MTYIDSTCTCTVVFHADFNSQGHWLSTTTFTSSNNNNNNNALCFVWMQHRQLCSYNLYKMSHSQTLSALSACSVRKKNLALGPLVSYHFPHHIKAQWPPLYPILKIRLLHSFNIAFTSVSSLCLLPSLTQVTLCYFDRSRRWLVLEKISNTKSNNKINKKFVQTKTAKCLCHGVG